VDLDLLFKPRLAEEDIEIPGVGTLRIRALNRLEALHVSAAKSEADRERRILVIGVVDPTLTEDDVKRWQRASAAGEIEVVSTRIAVLSGMAPDSAKEAVKEFEANPDAEFPVLPSPEAGHDGGPATGGDE
jgi:hypothetical protein